MLRTLTPGFGAQSRRYANPPTFFNSATTAATPSRWRSAVNKNGRPARIRVASRSITSSEAPT